MKTQLIFEIFALAMTVGGFVIAFITLRHKFKQEERAYYKAQNQLLLAHAEWKKNIEFEIEKLKRETEEMRASREKNLEKIWSSIEENQDEHVKDMKAVDCKFEDMMKEIRGRDESLMKMLTGINNVLIKLEARFEDHKETHNVKTGTRR